MMHLIMRTDSLALLILCILLCHISTESQKMSGLSHRDSHEQIFILRQSHKSYEWACGGGLLPAGLSVGSKGEVKILLSWK